ncbi:hypothetical protein FKM82_012664 [Ascaphus truei]
MNVHTKSNDDSSSANLSIPEITQNNAAKQRGTDVISANQGTNEKQVEVCQADPEVIVPVEDMRIAVSGTLKKISDILLKINYSSDPAEWKITADLTLLCRKYPFTEFQIRFSLKG